MFDKYPELFPGLGTVMSRSGVFALCRLPAMGAAFSQAEGSDHPQVAPLPHPISLPDLAWAAPDKLHAWGGEVFLSQAGWVWTTSPLCLLDLLLGSGRANQPGWQVVAMGRRAEREGGNLPLIPGTTSTGDFPVSLERVRSLWVLEGRD